MVCIYSCTIHPHALRACMYYICCMLCINPLCVMSILFVYIICLYSCIHIYIYIHIHIHIYTFIQICIHVYMHTYLCICIHVHTYTYKHTCTYIHIHTYTYIYMHIHIHTYTYIYIVMYTSIVCNKYSVCIYYASQISTTHMYMQYAS